METNFNFIGLEKDIEAHILENILDISTNCMWGDIKRVERQYILPISNGKIIADIAIWHTDGTGTFIEVKKTNSNRNNIISAISQVLFYGMIAKKCLGFTPRLVIASNEIMTEIYDIKKEYDLPINILVIDGDKCTYIGK
jgi:hypothetical protein